MYGKGTVKYGRLGIIHCQSNVQRNSYFIIRRHYALNLVWSRVIGDHIALNGVVDENFIAQRRVL